MAASGSDSKTVLSPSPLHPWTNPVFCGYLFALIYLLNAMAYSPHRWAEVIILWFINEETKPREAPSWSSLHGERGAASRRSFWPEETVNCSDYNWGVLRELEHVKLWLLSSWNVLMLGQRAWGRCQNSHNWNDMWWQWSKGQSLMKESWGALELFIRFHQDGTTLCDSSPIYWVWAWENIGD